MELISRRTYAVFAFSVFVTGLCFGVGLYAALQGHWLIVMIAAVTFGMFNHIAGSNYKNMRPHISDRRE